MDEHTGRIVPGHLRKQLLGKAIEVDWDERLSPRKGRLNTKGMTRKQAKRWKQRGR